MPIPADLQKLFLKDLTHYPGNEGWVSGLEKYCLYHHVFCFDL